MATSTLTRALELAAFPASAMVLGAAAVFFVAPARMVLGATQHFAAGIVLCATSVELLPPMSKAPATGRNMAAIAAGFLLGVLLMLGVKYISGEECDHEESMPEVEDVHEQTARIQEALLACGDGSSTEVSFEDEDEEVAEARRLRRWRRRLQRMPYGARAWASLERQASAVSAAFSERPEPFPWDFVLAVTVDSTVDGLLLGVSLVAGEKAGAVMAVALGFEMFFLALTLAATLRAQPWRMSIPAQLLMPAVLLVSAALGCFAAGKLAANPTVFLGILSFGTSALLYLVAEELLLEAHNGGQPHHWYIDQFFFFGYLSVLLLDKI